MTVTVLKYKDDFDGYNVIENITLIIASLIHTKTSIFIALNICLVSMF